MNISASSIKDFLIHEYLFKIIHIDKNYIVKEERHFVKGTAFHFLMEHGQEKFLKNYSIADSYLKKDLIEFILKKDDSQDMKKRCKSTKTTLDMLREKYYEYEYGHGRFQNESLKIKLTSKEGNSILNAYKYALSQPLWDMGGKYYYEEKYAFNYKDHMLVIKPDRYRIEKDGKFYSIKEYQDLLTKQNIGLTFDDLQQRKVFSEGATCIIRDFKTCADISRMKSGLMFGDQFGYILSMSWYYAVIYLMTGIKNTTVLLDIIELENIVGDVVNIPIEELNQKFTWLYDKLILLIDKIDNNSWSMPTHEEILSHPKLKEYAIYMPSEQESFTYLASSDNEFI